MMTIALLFWALVILCCGYAALYGGRDGRLIAMLYAGAVALTVPAQMLQREWAGGTNWPVFLVDLALLAGLYAVAINSRRYWPLWVAGFHLITLTTHLATLAAPTYAFQVYFGLATLWSIPKLLILVLGIALDQRAGIGDHEFDPAHRTK